MSWATMSRAMMSWATMSRATMSRPDVGLDTRATTHMSAGMLAYARELAARLPRVAPDLRFATFGAGDNFDVAEQIAIPLQLWRMRPRLAHFLTPYAPLAVPVPYVITIHDLIHVRLPQYAKPKARWYFRVVVRRVARAARRVITDDERTAQDLVDAYGLDRERIAVIPLGAQPAPVEPIRRERPYVIYVGNRRPHKDIPTLVAGWESAAAQQPLDLVLTGEPDPILQARPDSGRQIVFLGNLEHGELMRWVAGAQALVHASLREGFGLPLLEALQVETPVVASETAVPEVLRPYARTFRAGDAAGLARAIEAVLEGSDRRVTALGRSVTSTLTWDRCARETAAIYRTVLQELA